MKKILLLATVLLIAVAGCSLLSDSTSTKSEQMPAVTEQDPPLGWSLTVGLSEENPKPGERVQIEYAGNGHFRGTAYGIRILFLDENMRIIKEVPVENLTTERYYNTVNSTVPDVPVYLIAKMDGWDTPGMELDAIKGGFYKSDEGASRYRLTNESEFIYNDSAR